MSSRSKAKKEEPADVGSDVVMEEAPTSHQPESRDDMSVDQNDDEGDIEEDDIDEEEEEEVQRVRLVCQTLLSYAPFHAYIVETPLTLMTRLQLPGSTPTAASFEFLNEGHTLGNALRYIIMKK